MVRRQLIFSGRVQGVGFRYTSFRIAQQYLVTGWVKNLPDGSVQMCLEGEAGDISRFVSEVEETVNGLGYGRVDSCRWSDELAATGEWNEFEIH